ncbi:MchC protein [Enterovibrio norvegicus]|uniref:MchC protein n=1 Tax=Enterovibrio norvegicus TaxID=188144 RepID=UPI003550DFAB
MNKNKLATYDNPLSKDVLFLGDSLSQYSFVEYDTFKVKGAEIAWINNDYLRDHEIDIETAEQQILENFAYVSRQYADDVYLDLDDRKVFLADRYGSAGEVGNGGSSRCGINGHFQVKGNGTNPLVAVNVDVGHSTGKLPLSEAVSEAIWSEICHRELPYGALRIVAIIRTPQTIIGANTFGDVVEQPCALMIRELATRPAHYEPSLYFWPEPEFVRLRDATHKVVELAVNQLEKKEYKLNGSKTPIYDIAERFVTRFAAQIAASRIKGFPHGSLTSSNVALDGRFLDLGTISALGDFSNVILTAGLGASWDDHLGVAEWLENFFYYLNKHSDSGLDEKQGRTLVEKFLAVLETQENIYTAMACGIPEKLTNFEEIGKHIKRELRKGKEHVSRLGDFDELKFSNELNQALELVGFPNCIPNFKYRNQKFSRFTIFADSRLQGMCGSKEQIAKLVDEYLE